jgi:inhibitor of cysteine peptidase
MPTITLTRADDGRTVDLRPGDVVVIHLEENPTTGYQWTVQPGGHQVMALESSDYVRSPGAGVGGGGERVLTFKAVEAGTEAVGLQLSRGWQSQNAIPETFAVTFRAQD